MEDFVKINGETKVIGFFGETYRTSKIYALYNSAFQALNLNFVYVPFAVTDLKKALEGVRTLGIHAIGVTIPYKIEIIPYLDGLDEDAKRIGAVNVVLNKDGKLIGGNTDGRGAVKALLEKTQAKGKKIIILGAGGAARAIAFAATDEGGELLILNRTVIDAEILGNQIKGRFGGLELLPSELPTADILINATPVGAQNFIGTSIVEPRLLHNKLTIMETISNPSETKLVLDARAAGCKVVLGERMLLWQAVEKFRYYTGMAAPIEVMEKALLK